MKKKYFTLKIDLFELSEVDVLMASSTVSSIYSRDGADDLGKDIW